MKDMKIGVRRPAKANLSSHYPDRLAELRNPRRQMALSLGVKSPEIEAGRRYIFEVKVKNGWSCIARRRPVGMPEYYIDLKTHQNILTYLLTHSTQQNPS